MFSYLFLFSPYDIDHAELSEYQGPREFYHIESIDEAQSRSSSVTTTSSFVQSIPRKHYRVYNILDERSNSCTSLSSLSSDAGSRKKLWFDDEYTTKSFENKWPSKGRPTNFPAKYRPKHMKKPNRVTIFSLPPRSSPSTLTDLNMTLESHQMKQISYYKDEDTGVPIKHIRLTE